MTVYTLSTATFENNDTNPKDETRLGVVCRSSARISSADLHNLWATILGTIAGGSTHNIGSYFASCLSRTTPGVLLGYDITAHLDGSPHGSPYVSDSITMPGAISDSRGNQLSALITYLDSDYYTTATVTGSGSVPTPESAQDMGAPATHTGQLKGKARHAGRFNIAPLSNSAVGVDGNANPILTSTTYNNLALNWAEILVDVGTLGPIQSLSVWSRRDALARDATQGWVDHSVKTLRRREFLSNVRTTF